MNGFVNNGIVNGVGALQIADEDDEDVCTNNAIIYNNNINDDDSYNDSYITSNNNSNNNCNNNCNTNNRNDNDNNNIIM